MDAWERKLATFGTDYMSRGAAEIQQRLGLSRLNAIWGKAHVAAIRGDRTTAGNLIDSGRREFDVSCSEEQTSDYAAPWWRVNVFMSLLAARMGNIAGDKPRDGSSGTGRTYRLLSAFALVSSGYLGGRPVVPKG